MIKIAPSLLSVNPEGLEGALRKIEGAADLLHIDIMDGRFVPMKTFGVETVGRLRRLSGLPFDVHLMVADPEAHLKAFAGAGAEALLLHVEALKGLEEALEAIKALGLKCGLALNPETPASSLKPVLQRLDLVLVMSVMPGLPGQRFMPEVLPKVAEVRGARPSVDVAVDGGVNPSTAPLAVKAGANILVAGSAVFDRPDPAKAIEEIRRSVSSFDP